MQASHVCSIALSRSLCRKPPKPCAERCYEFSQGDGHDSDRSKNILALASAPMESSIYPAGSMLGFDFPWFIQRDRWLAIPSRSQHCEIVGRGSTGTRYLHAHGL